MPPSTQPSDEQARGLKTRIGRVEIDWPKSIGYFGGVALAVGFDVISPPIGLFIAAIPILRVITVPGHAWPIRAVADTLQTAAKPVSGDADGAVRMARRHARRSIALSIVGRPPRLA